MATWTGVVTNGGKAQFASWINGTIFNFDTAESGTGTVPEAALIAQTALVNKKQDISILGGARVADGIKLTIQITAPTTGYTLNQIGIKGSLGGGASVLTALFQTTEGISIPSAAQTPDFIYKFFATIMVSNTGTFTLTIDTSAVVAQSTLDAAMAAKQDIITAEGILMGDGAGNITTATAGTEYGFPLLTGTADPTATTAGAIGQHYFNTDTGEEFVCTGKTDNNYNWKKIGVSSANEILLANGKTVEQAFDGKADLVGGKIPVTQLPAMDYDTEGSAVAVQTNLDTHKANSTIHTTTSEKAAWNAKADKASPATSGNLAGLNANGNPVDSGKKPADFANAAHQHGAGDISSGTLSVPRGGTGAITFPLGNFLRGNNAGVISSIAAADIPPILGRGHATCTTAAGTAVKSAISTGFVRSTGAVVGVKFSYTNTAASPSLNVNGTGSAAIINGLTSLPPEEGEIVPGTHFFMFNGSQWVLLNPFSKGGRTFVLDITFESNLSGKAFTISGGGFTFSGTVPVGLVATVDVPERDTTYTVACDGEIHFVTTTNYFGIYPIKVGISPVFGENSWTQIGRAISTNTIPPSWKLRDEKDVTLTTGEVLTFQIGGLRHDNLADGSGKAPFTLILKNLMAETRQMHSTFDVRFVNSEMYAWLTGVLFPSLPADLRAIIKPVRKEISTGPRYNVLTTDDMLIFLLSAMECGQSGDAVGGEGMQYPIFTDDASRVKHLANGATAATQWKTRSINANTMQFIAFTETGALNINYSINTDYAGVCFGVCI